MICTHISRVSAALLLAGGLVLLFASDEILPRLISGYPPAAAWVGQLVAGGWLGIGALNWYSRSTLLGGIYGRPIVLANAAMYFVSAMALVKVGVLAVPFAILAVLYGWLMFRGPFERDIQRKRKMATQPDR